MSKKVEQEMIQTTKTLSDINAFCLLVKSPFDKYKKGDLIKDKDSISKILGTNRESMVLKVNRKVK